MITVTISKAALKEAGACAAGIALFDTIKRAADAQRATEGKPPRRGLRVRWSRLHALWLSVAYPEFAAWLIGAGLVPSIAFQMANLDGANWQSDREPPTGWKKVPKNCSCCVMLRRVSP